MIKRFLKRLSKLKFKIKSLFKKRYFKKTIYWDMNNQDDNEKLRDRYIYVFHSGERKKWAKYNCPCGCGEVVNLNLMKSHQPYWIIEEKTDGSLSISPSVNMTSNCKSHYFIRNNNIDWV